MDNSENKFPETDGKPWYKKPCVEVPEGYNPYRDDTSVFNEVYEENKDCFGGAEPKEGETPQQFDGRKRYEWEFARSKAKKKLSSSANRMTFTLIMHIGFLYGLLFAVENVIAFFPVSGLDFDLFNNLLELSLFLIGYPSIFIWFTIGKKNKVRTFYKKPEVSGLFIFRWCVISLGVTYLVAMIFGYFFDMISQFGFNVNDLSSPVPDTPLKLIFSFLFVVVGAPICEEIMFRGILLTDHLKFGCWHAAITTGVLFGLLHGNHQQMFYAAALGVIFAVIDIKAGSIIPSTIAHMAVNLYSFISEVFFYFTNYNELMETGESFSELDGPTWAIFGANLLDILVYVLIGAALILLTVELAVNGKKYPMPKGDSGLTQSEKATAFWFAPVTVVTVLILIGLIIYTSFIPPELIEEIVTSLAAATA